MDYDFITTCNWTATGTYTLRAYRGGSNLMSTLYSLIHYRKKGTTTWSALNSSGEISITSTGEWEIANDWNKSGNNVLHHSYYGITAINSCTDVYFDETALGTTVGDYFMEYCWASCSNLKSMPSGFNLPTNITTVGNLFLSRCWQNCTSLTSIPSGFNIPTGITTIGDTFLWNCWYGCTSLTSMPSGFNIPSGLTTVGNFFLYYCWYGCISLSSMPSGFNIPSGLTTVGTAFLGYCWHNCTALDDNDYTEDITFEFTTGTNVFGGTCPITTDSPIVGTKETPVNVAVNRYVAPLTNTGNFFNFI